MMWLGLYWLIGLGWVIWVIWGDPETRTWKWWRLAFAVAMAAFLWFPFVAVGAVLDLLGDE